MFPGTWALGTKSHHRNRCRCTISSSRKFSTEHTTNHLAIWQTKATNRYSLCELNNNLFFRSSDLQPKNRSVLVRTTYSRQQQVSEWATDSGYLAETGAVSDRLSVCVDIFTMDVEGDRIRVVIMGDNRVGKSAILERLLRNTFQVFTLLLHHSN